MSLFTSINLSELPPPSIIEELDYETLLAATKTELQSLELVDALTKDGEALRLLTRPALLTGAVDTVCLERRQYVQSGEFRYHIVAPANCTNGSR